MTAPAEPRVLKHQVVRAKLDRMLDNMQVGDPFPAEREIAEKYDVARETVRQALRELLLAGRVERRGRTTIVARPKILQPLAMGSYTEAVKSQGMSAGRILVGWTDLIADESLAATLDVEIGAPIIQLERVLTTDGVRVGLETTRLPASTDTPACPRASTTGTRCTPKSAAAESASSAPSTRSRPRCPTPASRPC